MSIAQISAVDPIEAATNAQVPVDYRISITNPLEHPVTLTSLEFETVGGSGGYAMKRVRHTFTRVIPARGSDSFQVRAWVQPLQISDRGDVTVPVMLRGTALFDANGTPMRTAFASRAAQNIEPH